MTISSPHEIGRLVELAFVLEPLLEKEGCSTRYKDLPGKPIYNFIIAGVNTSSVFEDFAREVISDNKTSVFSHFQQALKASNCYKAHKYINVGLLEFMFISVKARILSETIEECLENLRLVIEESTTTSILELHGAYHTALSTSAKDNKKHLWQNTHSQFLGEESLYNFFKQLIAEFPDASTSHYQVAHEYLNGFPIIRDFVLEIDDELGIMKSLEATYVRLHSEQPEIKVGILADFCAAAMFIYLSFQDQDYQISSF